MKFTILLGSLIAFILTSCATTENKPVVDPKPDIQPAKNPSGKEEKILNEQGKEIQLTTADPEFFRKKSNSYLESFRVIISSDSYRVIQFRNTERMTRKPDLGGDKLIMEEIKPFDAIDYVDDGIVDIKLSPYTGKLENVKFYTRVPRINEIALLIQNDATRWILEHKDKDNPSLLHFRISYQVKLKKRASREEVIEKVRK